MVIACASMALADAGIEMYDMVPAISAVSIFMYRDMKWSLFFNYSSRTQNSAMLASNIFAK